MNVYFMYSIQVLKSWAKLKEIVKLRGYECINCMYSVQVLKS